MKITFVSHLYHPHIGGIETHLKEISERLVQHGYEIEVVCTDPSSKNVSNDIINGVRITRYPCYSYREKFFFSPQIYFHLLTHVPDILHVHDYHSFPSFLASQTNHPKMIFTPHYSNHNNILYSLYKPLTKSIFNKSKKIICVSNYEFKKLQSDFNIDHDKITVIPNGINPPDLSSVPQLHKDILYVGRLEEYKGVQYIIKSLSHLPSFNLTIIGKGSYEPSLHKLAKKLNVEHRITWLRDVSKSDLEFYYKSSKVLVNLSRIEAFGITVAESLSYGTPCIVARGSALGDFIDGETCIGLDYPIDTCLLAMTIMCMNKTEPRKMMDWDEVTDRLVRVYEGLP